MELLFLLLVIASIIHAQENLLNKTILESLGTLSPILYHHIESSSFADLLNQPNNSLTFFLPNDAALNTSLQSGALNFSNNPHNALTFLTLSNAYTTNILSQTRKFYTTLSPQHLQMSIGPDNSTIKIYAGYTESHIITKDITCSNGIIHVVDTLLEPPLDPLSTISLLAETETMEGLLKSLNISDTISGQNRTILAPTNAAWDAANGAQLPFGTLVHNLKYMVLEGVTLSEQWPARFISDYKQAPVSIDISGAINDGQATVVKRNILTTHGVIHVIDKVLSADAKSNETSPASIASNSPTVETSDADHEESRNAANTNKAPFPFINSSGCNCKTGFWLCFITAFVAVLLL